MTVREMIAVLSNMNPEAPVIGFDGNDNRMTVMEIETSKMVRDTSDAPDMWRYPASGEEGETVVWVLTF